MFFISFSRLSIDLRRPLAGQSPELLCIPLQPFSAKWGPFELQAVATQALLQIRDLGHRSVFVPTTKRAFRSCSLTWRIYRSTENVYYKQSQY